MPTLAEIPQGRTATVVDVTGDDSIAIRLMEMGVIDGESITVIGCAPMGDPIEVAIRGYHLSLRKLEASRVEVELNEVVADPPS